MNKVDLGLSRELFIKTYVEPAVEDIVKRESEGAILTEYEQRSLLTVRLNGWIKWP
jgi:hypothetical protein